MKYLYNGEFLDSQATNNITLLVNKIENISYKYRRKGIFKKLVEDGIGYTKNSTSTIFLSPSGIPFLHRNDVTVYTDGTPVNNYDNIMPLIYFKKPIEPPSGLIANGYYNQGNPVYNDIEQNINNLMYNSNNITFIDEEAIKNFIAKELKEYNKKKKV